MGNTQEKVRIQYIERTSMHFMSKTFSDCITGYRENHNDIYLMAIALKGIVYYLPSRNALRHELVK